ncbi:MAG TPA: hypothetical protein ENG95_07025 [Nitrospirae bacterium]|nr:hypothetical protein BMS3Abin10_02033 [bacterium BMS3Abin10]GBE39378.1 hypothetical protein BMS3Bbin08_02000 [bacterium BMS3Bbin08]HDH50619.1 hypothetical protein [Nitrospirota bacterium]HDK16635.1 hypothetical protein [Nitrospirota bacterium]HDK80937.1 hypothetical protein [Nitrospirota bacterium]
MSGKLPENIRKLFLTFKEAVEAERAAQTMYLHAKELSDEDVLKEILEGFYQDEVRHERVLMERYNKLRQEFNIEDEP